MARLPTVSARERQSFPPHYWHAEELLVDGRGLLVPFDDSPSISGAVCDLLRNEITRHAIRKNAYLIGRKMVWSHVAHEYAQSFQRARHEHSGQTAKRIEPPTLDRQAALPVWRLDHLFCLTDDSGMLQHAVYTLPNYEHGYCTDDNARALILMMLLEELEERFPERTRLTSVYAAFLQNAFDGELVGRSPLSASTNTFVHWPISFAKNWRSVCALSMKRMPARGRADRDLRKRAPSASSDHDGPLGKSI